MILYFIIFLFTLIITLLNIIIYINRPENSMCYTCIFNAYFVGFVFMVFTICLCNLAFLSKTEMFVCKPKFIIDDFPSLFQPIIIKENMDLPSDQIPISIIKDVISQIPTQTPLTKFDELQPSTFNLDSGNNLSFRYDKESLIHTINLLFDKIKETITPILPDKINELCNQHTQCAINLDDKKIIKLAKNKQYVVIFGQLLFSINISSYQILYEYIITESNGILIIFDLKFKGIQLKNHISGYDKSTPNNVKILSNPSHNTYNPNTYLFDSNEPSAIIDKSINVDQFLKNKELIADMPALRCFGREDAFTKSTCENIYFNGEKQENIGVWDRNCVDDSECPLNAKCNSGVCDFPDTVIPISPRKYIIPNVSNFNLKNNNLFTVEISSDSENYVSITSDLITKLEDGSFKLQIDNNNPKFKNININNPDISIRISKVKGNYVKILQESDFSKKNNNSIIISNSIFL